MPQLRVCHMRAPTTKAMGIVNRRAPQSGQRKAELCPYPMFTSYRPYPLYVAKYFPVKHNCLSARTTARRATREVCSSGSAHPPTRPTALRSLRRTTDQGDIDHSPDDCG